MAAEAGPATLCRGGDIAFVLGHAGPPNSARRARGLGLDFRDIGTVDAANGWGQGLERNAFAIAAASAVVGPSVRAFLIVAVVTGVASRTLRSLGPFTALRALVTIASREPFAALWALRTIVPLRSLLVAAAVLGVLVLAGLGEFLFALIVVDVLAALAALLVEPGAALAQHAIIMVGELQIIFSLDAVAGKLGIARHALVFLEQLGGVAALAIILAIAIRAPAQVLGPLTPATATATALTIIDQMRLPSKQKLAPWPHADIAAPKLLLSRARL